MHVMTVVGTRPELIKLCCVISELDSTMQHTLVHTGQNYDYELNQVFFEDLEIRKPDFFLNAAAPGAAETIGNIISLSDKLIDEVSPDAFLVYGDTNSCLSVISAKRKKVPIFHMEAGNRCFDARVPEEINRKIVDHLSDINMVISEHARRYLMQEGIRPDSIIKVGSSLPEVLSRQQPKIESSAVLGRLELEPGGFILASLHREENVDEPARLKGILQALGNLGDKYDCPVIMSTHPRTRHRMEKLEKRAGATSLTFITPVGFSDYITLQRNSMCVVSDSGTIAEEASLLGFPAVTIRESHERPEGMDEGTVVVAAPENSSVLAAVALVLDQAKRFSDPPKVVADYKGDSVSRKVVRIIQSYQPWVNRTTWSRVAL